MTTNTKVDETIYNFLIDHLNKAKITKEKNVQDYVYMLNRVDSIEIKKQELKKILSDLGFDGEKEIEILDYEIEKLESVKKNPRVYNRNLRLLLDNYMENANQFYEYHPYFYDKSGLWWVWNENRWELTDDIDMERSLDKELGFCGQTISAVYRTSNLRAMMWVGREKTPKEAPKKWIQFKDKAFSLKSKKIYKVTKDYFFCNPIPYEMGTTDDTPVMDRLFKDWVGEEYVKSLYQVIAYCCYSDYPIQTLVCLYGSGRNGKTCFLKLLGKFLGKDNICSTDLDTLMESRFESFKLYKKICCTMGETNFGIFDKSSMFKKLTGGDLIGFEAKGKTPFNDFSYAKLIIASNSLPSSNDTSDGFYRRWFIIDFPNQFNEGRDVLSEIPEIEYNNLARKVVKLLPELLEKGKFNKQGTIEERKMKYILSSNPLPYFIDNFCEKDPTGFISYNELYTNYVAFLTKTNKRIVKIKEFKDSLIHEGFFVEKTSRKIGDEFVNGYFVIGLYMKINQIVTIVPIVRNFPLGYSIYGKEVKNQSQWSQLSQNPVSTEFIDSLSWDSTQAVWQKCIICQDSPCNLNWEGKPMCQAHWKDKAEGEHK